VRLRQLAVTSHGFEKDFFGKEHGEKEVTGEKNNEWCTGRLGGTAIPCRVERERREPFGAGV